MVIEDRETGQDEEDEDEGADIDEFEGPTHRSQSPGGLSQMSGTTAMTSRSAASAMTSHSVTEIDSLDPLMVEYLPELLRSSWRILDQLAPPDASSGMIETIVKELRIIGSRTAKIWQSGLRFRSFQTRCDPLRCQHCNTGQEPLGKPKGKPWYTELASTP
jgi:hypothetical protein